MFAQLLRLRSDLFIEEGKSGGIKPVAQSPENSTLGIRNFREIASHREVQVEGPSRRDFVNKAQGVTALQNQPLHQLIV